jgi:hypothetical protein
MGRITRSLAILAIVSIGGWPVSGQSRWVPARTPDGRPDLQGTWINPTITPFERPAGQSKAVLTAEEAAELERRTLQRRAEADRNPRRGDVGSYNEFWFDQGTTMLSTRQTSLVVEPPDGRVPLTPAAEQSRDGNEARSTESYEFMSVWDRCITRGVPGGMFPAGYNNAYQIVQTPGYVVILHEMIHHARIIPIDNGVHPPSSVTYWDGDARGRWDGQTLVVDTRNFNGKGWIATNAAAARIKGIPQTEALHLIERFTRVDADTIQYEVTIEDPAMYARPWKVSFPLTRDPEYQIFEYACHEGNRVVENVLRAARLQEQDGR